MKKVFFVWLYLLYSSVFAEPIDVVYTWVDGADPQWLKVRNEWALKYNLPEKKGDANSNNRYRNRNELKYSLRSIYMYAPFVHHIYIVTFGQRPEWLVDHPQVTVVDHKEIFLSDEDLPTFNSQAIEANLHRVPGLAEKFIYFNDDVLLNAPVQETDFFYNKGIVVNISGSAAPTGEVRAKEISYYSAWKNTNALLNMVYKKEKRSTLAHAPFGLKKSLMQEAEYTFPAVFQEVSSHHFREPSDFVMTNGFVQYFAYYTKRAKMKEQPSLFIHINDDVKKIKKKFKELENGTYLFFCLEDALKEDNKQVDLLLQSFLEEKFPFKAPWEV